MIHQFITELLCGCICSWSEDQTDWQPFPLLCLCQSLLGIRSPPFVYLEDWLSLLGLDVRLVRLVQPRNKEPGTDIDFADVQRILGVFLFLFLFFRKGVRVKGKGPEKRRECF